MWTKGNRFVQNFSTKMILSEKCEILPKSWYNLRSICFLSFVNLFLKWNAAFFFFNFLVTSEFSASRFLFSILIKKIAVWPFIHHMVPLFFFFFKNGFISSSNIVFTSKRIFRRCSPHFLLILRKREKCCFQNKKGILEKWIARDCCCD